MDIYYQRQENQQVLHIAQTTSRYRDLEMILNLLSCIVHASYNSLVAFHGTKYHMSRIPLWFWESMFMNSIEIVFFVNFFIIIFKARHLSLVRNDHVVT